MTVRLPNRRAMASRKRQRGMTTLGWVGTILLVGAGITAGLRLLPHYIDYQTVTSIVEALPRSEVHGMRKGEIRENLRKRFKINNIRALKPKNVIKVNRIKGSTLVEIDYEVREHLIANVYVVLHFNKEYEYS